MDCPVGQAREPALAGWVRSDLETSVAAGACQKPARTDCRKLPSTTDVWTRKTWFAWFFALLCSDYSLRMVNDGFELKGSQRLTAAKLDRAPPPPPPPGRLLKRAEAAFRLLLPNVLEFDHFTPADWLIRNPAVLDSKEPFVEVTLDNAEQVFAAVARHIGP